MKYIEKPVSELSLSFNVLFGRINRFCKMLYIFTYFVKCDIKPVFIMLGLGYVLFVEACITMVTNTHT